VQSLGAFVRLDNLHRGPVLDKHAAQSLVNFSYLFWVRSPKRLRRVVLMLCIDTEPGVAFRYAGRPEAHLGSNVRPARALDRLGAWLPRKLEFLAGVGREYPALGQSRS
jgi:hypothetical protein